MLQLQSRPNKTKQKSAFVMKCSVFYQNVRGLRTKADTCYNNVAVSDYDIISLSETWLNSSFSSSDYFPPAYTVFRRDRNYEGMSANFGGGVLIAVKKHLQVVRRFDLEFSDESVWVEITFADSNLLIGTFYFPPSLDVARFSEQMDLLCDQLDVDKYRILILGDFNVPDINWNLEHAFSSSGCVTSKQNTLLYSVNYLGLKQLNGFQNPAGNVLDLALVNFHVDTLAPVSKPLVHPDAWHVPFSASFTASYRTAKQTSYESFAFNRGNYLGLFRFLDSLDWAPVYKTSNVNCAVELLTNCIKNAIEMFVPKKCSRSSRYPHWFSHELRSELRRKLHYHRKYKANRTQVWYNKFSKSRALAKVLIKRDKESYRESLERSLNRDPKYFWRYINDRMTTSSSEISLCDASGKVLNEPASVANTFADYFASVYSCSRNGLSAPDVTDNGSDCLSIPFFENADIKLAIQKLKPKLSVAFDGIPSFIVKGCSSIFTPILTHIFNLSLSSCTFPSIWKNAITVPIHKKGRTDDPKNYRPISLLCPFAKVYEIVLSEHISSFFKHKILPSQHGFVRGRSVESNLVSFLSFVSPIVCQRGQVDTIYFDMSKAFDLVDHSLLLEKLKSYGMSTTLCTLLHNYLSDRHNFVRILGHLSQPFVTLSGVPQGSILGPILFNVFINDLSSCVLHSEILQYADDIKLFREIVSLEDCVKLMDDVKSVSNWCSLNRLTLNPTKTVVMSFAKKLRLFHFCYQLDNAPLQRVDCTRDLGVYIDSSLSFNTHVNNIVNASFRTLGVISRITREFSMSACFMQLYLSLIRSKLEFSSVVWNSIGRTHQESIENVQKRFFRIFYDRYVGRTVYFEYKRLLERYNCSTLSARRRDRDLEFLFKCLHGVIDCPDLTSAINIHVPRRVLRTSLSFYVNQFFQTCPMTRIQTLYNTFDDSCIDIFNPSFAVFKFSLTNL